jgi:flavin-dependent dehydrogenase
MDVVIAGGGPAGTIAALVLARGGARVTVFDRARFPREKLCGDTINPGALAVLRDLGLDGVTEGGLPIDGMLVSGERGVRVTGAYGGGQRGVALPRRVLDLRLLQAAIGAGVRVEEGVLVQRPIMSEDGGAVTGLMIRSPAGVSQRRMATVTIAADGAYSRIARALALARPPRSPRRWAIGGVFRGVTGLSSFGEMHVRERWYIGVAPLPGGLANACVVTADRQALRDSGLLWRVLREDDEVSTRFSRADMLHGPTVLGPLALDASTAGVPGLLLAGDAAGFIDPMTGDGLRFAFRGAALAAGEALRVLNHGWRDAHDHLARARLEEFGAKWRFNRTLRAVAASPAAVRAAALGAAIAPPLLRRMIRYAGDAGPA